jgi:tetratricopeptide (TPR) repeat protein
VAARLLLAALPLLVAFPAIAEDAPKYIVIDLVDGTKVVGRVVENECTDDVLVVRQLKGDAKATIPWDHIREKQSHELRVEYGFDVAEAAHGSMMMPGHEIRNKAGVTFRGLLVNEKTARADGAYILKTSEGERRIPVADVKSGPTPVELSHLDVYTPRELYERKLADVTSSRGGENQSLTAEDHYQLAEFALLIDALEEAKLHYEKAIELNDPKYTREKLERRLGQVQQLLTQSDARAALKDIQRAIFDRRFDKVTALLAAFREKFGTDVGLAKAANDLDEKSKEERREYYIGIVPVRVRDTVKTLLERKVKAADEKFTLGQAQEYAEGEASAEESVGRQAIEAVAVDLGIPPEDVMAFWTNRKKQNIYKAFYRDGTFIVIENLEDALSKAPKPPKIGQGQSAPKLPAPTKPMTAEEWWKMKVSQHKTTDLRDWLYGRWAEKSQMCDPIDPKDENCPTCNGKGYTMKTISTPQGAVPFYNRCQTCYMAKFHRVVRFR